MSKGENGTERRSVHSIDKAVMVLEVMAHIDRDIDLATLAQRADLPKSTLFRLLQTMRQKNLVQQDPRTRRYRLGFGLIHLGKAAERQFDLERIVRPFLEELAKSSGETASFAVLQGDIATYLAQAVSDSIIRGVPPIGASLGLHCTAVGKVLLTSFSPHELDRLIAEHGLPRVTEKTIVNAEHLRKELDRVRESGFALDNEEAEPGGRCIAAPIRNRGQIMAAVSITGPTTRIRSNQIEEYATLVQRTATRIESALEDESL